MNKRRVLEFGNAIITLLSLVIITGLAFVVAFWLCTGGSYVYHIEPDHTTKGEIKDFQLIVLGSGKAVYRQWIENDKGKIVYNYPDKILDGVTSAQTYHSQLKLPVLPSGHYTIKATLYYKSNPLPIGNNQIDLYIGNFSL